MTEKDSPDTLKPDQRDSLMRVWSATFPDLKRGALELLLDRANRVRLAAGATVFRAGDACENYLLMISGSVRVYRMNADGREILLYRVETGESCILTTSCLLANEHYPASAVAETDIDAILLPSFLFDDAVAQSAQFRRFVLSSYSERVAALISLIEGVAFRKIDARLAACLLERDTRDGGLLCTHQALAIELGTAREVISRQLKQFENDGLITLTRGQIRIENSDALRRLVT